MANMINLWGETSPDLVGDDSTPTLTIGNSSSGIGLFIDTATNGTGVGLDVLSDNTSYASRVRSGASAAPALQLVHSVLQGPTIAPLQIIASAASGAFFDFRGAVISTASVALTAANTGGLIAVWYQGTGGNSKGYIPILANVAA